MVKRCFSYVCGQEKVWVQLNPQVPWLVVNAVYVFVVTWIVDFPVFWTENNQIREQFGRSPPARHMTTKSKDRRTYNIWYLRQNDWLANACRSYSRPIMLLRQYLESSSPGETKLLLDQASTLLSPLEGEEAYALGKHSTW